MARKKNVNMANKKYDYVNINNACKHLCTNTPLGLTPAKVQGCAIATCSRTKKSFCSVNVKKRPVHASE